MNLETLKHYMGMIPIPIIALFPIAVIINDLYHFQWADDAELKAKEAQVEGANAEMIRLKAQLKQIDTFKMQLEAKRVDLRHLAQKLEDMKGSISDTFDDAGFMKLAVTEAKKTGLSVEKIGPSGTPNNKVDYVEHGFEMGVRGVYVQVLVFLQRLSQLQTIVRIDNIGIKPTGSRLSGYVQVQGLVGLRGYHYLRSKADEISAKSKTPTAAPPADAGGKK